MSETHYPVTPRTRLGRRPERGHYDRATVHGILDEALYCHLAVAPDGQPVAIPTIHVRVGETLYLHGSPASRSLRALERGVPVCVTVTLVDGLVLARSAFHHSMNYRCVMVFGRAHRVRDPAEKRRALEALVEHVVPGRGRDARAPDERELRFTRLLALPLAEASAKVRSGPPLDDPEDLALPIWAGEIPLALVPGPPRPDPALPPEREAPAYVTGYRREASQG